MRTSMVGALLLASCGGAAVVQPPVERPEPVVTEEVAVAEPEPADTTGTTTYAVLPDGMRGGIELDRRDDGTRLVGAEGAIGLVDAAGHVRAVHRIGYGETGTHALFTSARTAMFVVGDSSPTRSDFVNRLVLWDLATDHMVAEDERASIVRAGHFAVAYGSGVVRVRGEDWLGRLEMPVIGLTCDASPTCIAYGDDGSIARLTIDEAGAITSSPIATVSVESEVTVMPDLTYAVVQHGVSVELLSLADGTLPAVEPVREDWITAQSSRREGSGWLVAFASDQALNVPEGTWRPIADDDESWEVEDHAAEGIGIRGTVSVYDVVFAGDQAQIAIASSERVLVAGDGAPRLEPCGGGGRELAWDARGTLLTRSGRRGATICASALPFDATRGPDARLQAIQDTDEASAIAWDEVEDAWVATHQAELDAWRAQHGNEGLDWAEDRTPEPQPPSDPVCAAEGSPCVRYARGHYLVYAASRPERTLLSLEDGYGPPAPFVSFAPGGRYLRQWVPDGTVRVVSLVPRPRVITTVPVASFVETEQGYAVLEHGTLRTYAFDTGRVATARVATDVEALQVVDATHVLAVTRDALVTFEVPGLARGASLPTGARPAPEARCEGTTLVTASRARIADGCVGARREHVSAEGRFRAVVDDDRIVVTRRADGARLTFAMTTEGAYAYADDGTFEGSGAILDSLVVRPPGSARQVAITTGAEARAQFERPGMIAAFFAVDIGSRARSAAVRAPDGHSRSRLASASTLADAAGAP